MSRGLAAFLFLVSVLLSPSAAIAKGAIAPSGLKKAPAVKTAAPTDIKPAAKRHLVENDTLIRTQSVVVPREDSGFVPPEGALYTTSDECA